MKEIDGVIVQKENSCYVFYIEYLSEEFKNLIRENLASICHGAADAATGNVMFSYGATLKEFIKRYNNKTDEQQKGLIGELLLQVLLQEQIDEFGTNSPFFNIEERNVKKGFDVVLTHNETNEMWLAESKAGNLHKNKTSNQTVVELINTAKNDLKGRLNGDSYSLWLNAIAGAKKVYEDNSDRKNAIIKILQECGNASYEERLSACEINVVLVGTLFHDMNDKIEHDHVKNKKECVENEKIFKNICVIGIQKNTFEAVYNFLEEESQLWVN